MFIIKKNSKRKSYNSSFKLINKLIVEYIKKKTTKNKVIEYIKHDININNNEILSNKKLNRQISDVFIVMSGFGQ